ncbi:hypothetical protein NE237_020235 [Protea cynaroides]|uniref:Uncharacterized protein n=1 Tax=Protea cynaroides TaxID=273540 RepID=A0A9Q0H913_9MAGN|nr:hypothetical protein NE237_020235 [Protea cynaroides]
MLLRPHPPLITVSSLHIALQERIHKPKEPIITFLQRVKTIANELSTAGLPLLPADFNMYTSFPPFVMSSNLSALPLLPEQIPYLTRISMVFLLNHEFLTGSTVSKFVLRLAPFSSATTSIHITQQASGHGFHLGRGSSSYGFASSYGLRTLLTGPLTRIR